MNSRILIPFLLVIAQSICAHGATYTVEQTVTNTVVDAYTARPIEGARVFHTWHRAGVAHHAETTTDADGVAVTEFPADAHEPRVGISASRYTPLSFSPTNTHYTHELIPTRTYTVRGVISTTEGEPIANAHVFLAPDDTAWAETIRGCDAWSDDEGGFIMHAVPVAAGDASVHVTAPKYQRIRDDSYCIVAEHSAAYVTIEMEKGVELTGRILYDDRRPAEGIRVWALSFMPGEDAFTHYTYATLPHARLIGSVVYTDTNGFYTLSGIPYETHILVYADHPLLYPTLHVPIEQRQTWSRTPSETRAVSDIDPIDFVIPTLQKWVELRVVSEDGAPVTNPIITASLPQFRQIRVGTRREHMPVEYEALSNGHILLSHVTADAEMTYHVWSERHSARYTSVRLYPFRTNTHEVVLRTLLEVRVTLYDAFNSTPVTNAYVVTSKGTYRPDEHGNFHYWLWDQEDVTVHAPGYAPTTRRLSKRPSEQLIVLPKTASIEAQVYDHQGNPVTDGGFVTLTFRLPGHLYLEKYGQQRYPINEKGIAVMTNIPVYSPVVILTTEKDDPWKPPPLTLRNIEPGKTYRCALTQTYFNVVHVSVPRPPQGDEPVCTYRRIPYWYSGFRRPSAVQSNEHTFVYTFNDMPSGSYTIRVERGPYMDVTTNIVVSYETSPHEIHLPYPSQEPASFKIKLPEEYLQGYALARTPPHLPFYLYVYSTNHVYYLWRSAESYLYISGLPSDTNMAYDISMNIRNTHHRFEGLTLDDSPFTPTLPPLGAITGVFEFSETQTIHVAFNEGEFYRGGPGPFYMPYVPYGTHTIRMYIRDYGVTNFNVTVDQPLVDIGTVVMPRVSRVTLRGRIGRPYRFTDSWYLLGVHSLSTPGTVDIDFDGQFELQFFPGEEIIFDFSKSNYTNFFIPHHDIDVGDIFHYIPGDDDEEW